MRLLVTGGAGFIGSNFVHYWLEKNRQAFVLVLDKLGYAGSRSNLAGLEVNSGFVFVHGDICDGPLVYNLLKRYEITDIVNFAAESHVDRSIDNAAPFIQTNVQGTQTLLDVARQYWLEDEKSNDSCRFHQVSTDEVYGDVSGTTGLSTEEAQYRPSSPYSASKAAADHLVQAWHRTYGLNTTISICSNNFGPRQHTEKLIPLTISCMLNNKPVPVYGDGLQKRDWIAVEDNVRGIARVLKRGVAGEAYNIGVRNEVANIDLVRKIGSILESEFVASQDLVKRFPDASTIRGEKTAELIEFVKDRPGHDRRYAIDPSRIETELGFRGRCGFEEALKATVRWYLARNPMAYKF